MGWEVRAWEERAGLSSHQGETEQSGCSAAGEELQVVALGKADGPLPQDRTCSGSYCFPPHPSCLLQNPVLDAGMLLAEAIGLGYGFGGSGEGIGLCACSVPGPVGAGGPARPRRPIKAVCLKW